jgi:hypothetical protein
MPKPGIFATAAIEAGEHLLGINDANCTDMDHNSRANTAFRATFARTLQG